MTVWRKSWLNFNPISSGLMNLLTKGHSCVYGMLADTDALFVFNIFAHLEFFKCS